MNPQSSILVVGPGAIGGVVAGILSREGLDVSLVCKHPDLAAKISEAGIHVQGVKGEFRAFMPAAARPEEFNRSFDFVLLATKAEDLKQATLDVLPFLHENSRVVSMQNGICEEQLAAVAGPGRTIGCVVGWGGTMHEPGRVEMTSGGECILGNWQRGGDAPLEELAGILDRVVETRTTDHILGELYSKLIINACITTLGAICGLYLGDMLSRRQVRRIFIGIMREALAVAKAMDLEVPPAASGRLDYEKFLSPGPFSGLKRHAFIRLIGIKYRRLKSSSLQSLERGRKTEVDNYNGYIWHKGQELGIPTPLNAQLTQMVREIETGKRGITPDNFREIR